MPAKYKAYGSPYWENAPEFPGWTCLELTDTLQAGDALVSPTAKKDASNPITATKLKANTSSNIGSTLGDLRKLNSDYNTWLYYRPIGGNRLPGNKLYATELTIP